MYFFSDWFNVLVSPSLRQDDLPDWVDCYDIDSIHSHYKGNYKRGGAAEGRAASFVVAADGRHLCILALNKVNIVTVNAILVLQVGETGRRTVGRTPLGLHVPSRCDAAMDDQDKTELQLQHEL